MLSSQVTCIRSANCNLLCRRDVAEKLSEFGILSLLDTIIISFITW